MMLPPPPLSLSAPELSAEPPSVQLPKRSVSSTELLYEKAMARFYKAMELDEKEQLKSKSACTSAECILPPLPSKRDSIGNSVERGLERKSSLRRRLSGEIPDVNINFAGVTSSSRDHINRVPSSPKRSLYPQESLDDPDYLSHVEDYTDDYTDSTASSGESETEKFKRRVREHGQPKRSLPGEELDTYHPRNRMTSPYASPDSDQAAEVLTKPYSLPNPDFIPKPILKRPSSVEGDSDDKRSSTPKGGKNKTQRKTFSKLFDRKTPVVGDTVDKKAVSPSRANEEPSEQQVEPPPKEEVRDPDERRGSSTIREKAKQLKMEMRQSSIEEQKVAIDHYSDLVKEKGNWRTATVPLYLNADDLKRAAGYIAGDDVEDIEPTTPRQVDTPTNAVDDCPLLSPSTRVLKTSQVEVMEQSQRNGAIVKSVTDDPHLENEKETRGRRATVNNHNSDRASSTASRPSVGGSRNSSAVRRTGKTPVEARVASRTRERSTSKSPLTVNRRPLAMKGQVDGDPCRRTPTPSLSRPMTPHEEQQQQQDIDTKVKSTMSYTTDLVLFVVACWVYLFKDARLAMPLVLLLVYRHIREHLPQWMVRKPN